MRPSRTRGVCAVSNFNPRTPRGVRLYCFLNPFIRSISIHAPLAGCDPASKYYISTNAFQSTHPSRGATSSLVLSSSCLPFQSTHPSRGATGFFRYPIGRVNFNPRTPRGVRHPEDVRSGHRWNFNPRTPRGVRPGTVIIPVQQAISIHAPLAGCDRQILSIYVQNEISIHAPLAGCDHSSQLLDLKIVNFNPRTPRGVRLQSIGVSPLLSNFNPRTPRGVRRTP